MSNHLRNINAKLESYMSMEKWILENGGKDGAN